MTTLFGTDGIRGRANEGAMTPEMILRMGLAAAKVATDNMEKAESGAKTERRPRIVIGKDTRLSGYMMESALTAGLVSGGAFPVLLGPMPTPAVSMLTRSLRADLGIMITASHNPFADNGIKFFAPTGGKLPDAMADAMSKLVTGRAPLPHAAPEGIGQAIRLEDAYGRYIEAVKQTVPRGLRLDGLRVVLDCANGAGYKVAPEILWELGADVTVIGDRPDGLNINQDCGATDTRALRAEVISKRADVGIALDGDGDRVIVCDERGQEADGDQVLALIAETWQRAGRLSGKAVVATVMSNMGLESHLQSLGLDLHRTAVGDRHVAQCMETEGLNLGGEQSGHIILRDFASTGDGLIAGIQVLAALKESGRRASDVLQVFSPVPQTTTNVRFAGTSPLKSSKVTDLIDSTNKGLGRTGRLLVRESGTEPVIRIMVECEDPNMIENVTDRLSHAIHEAA